MPHLIIGDTTSESVRIWVQGDATSTTCEVSLRPAPDNPPGVVHLLAENDYTAAFVIEGLRPDIEYTVFAAFAPSGTRIRGRARTFKASSDTPVSFSFVLSSCNLSVVSINDFLARLAITAGIGLASSSLEIPPHRWKAPKSRWLQPVARLVAKGALAFTARWLTGTTALKQTGTTYLRSPFLKLSAVFESCAVALPLPAPPQPTATAAEIDAYRALRDRWFLAVGDRVESSFGAAALVASVADDEKNNVRKVLLTQISGAFEKDAVLFRRVTKDRREELQRLGPITEVRIGGPWYEPPSFFIHAGDQIYYDFPEPRRAPDRKAYRLAYREAWFEDTALSHLLAHWPHYMTLDDHEILDQFAVDFLAPNGQPKEKYLHEASIAYREYAHALNPQTNVATSNRGPLWFTFGKGDAQFFVMDTRTARSNQSGQMIDAEQMSNLLSWMSRYKDHLKFVVTSVPFVAELNLLETERKKDWYEARGRNSPQDKWSATRFKGQRDKIIEHIAAERIEHLIFLTGDMHCCYHATMRIGTGATRYESTIVHELAGGPVNQLQLARVNEFERRCRSTTEGTMPTEFEVTLERFHGDVSAVMHLRVRYVERDEVLRAEVAGGREPRHARALTPEVEWNVIRTLTDPGPQGWFENEPPKKGRVEGAGPEYRSGEPVMNGRICFTKRRVPQELRRWP